MGTMCLLALPNFASWAKLVTLSLTPFGELHMSTSVCIGSGGNAPLNPTEGCRMSAVGRARIRLLPRHCDEPTSTTNSPRLA